MAEWFRNWPAASICGRLCRWCGRRWQKPEITLDDLDAIAVTSGPGLAGALLVGITYAKALAFAQVCR